MSRWAFAVDFGTTSTAAAMAVGGRVELVEIDGGRRMPSAVFWREGPAEGTGRLVLGEQAEDLAVRAPWYMERTPKRRIGDEFLLLGDQEIRVVDAVGAIFRRMVDEAIARRGGEPPGEVRLTHPVRWGRASLGALREAARIAGFDSPTFVPEPVAAAVHFASHRLSPGEHVAVYDLGGGTFDTAVLRRTDGSFEVVGAPGGDEYLGGEDFDERLYLFLGKQLSPEAWQSLREGSDRTWTHANAQFLVEARRAKEILSTSPDHDLYLPTPVDQELNVTVAQFQELIRSDLERSVAELKRTITSAGLQAADLAAIYLVGGSSRIPMIPKLIAERLGLAPETLDDPKSAIALGAAAHLTDAADTTPVPEPGRARPSPATELASQPGEPTELASQPGAPTERAMEPTEERTAARREEPVTPGVQAAPPAERIVRQPPRPPADEPPPTPGAPGSRRGWILAGALVGLLVIAGVALAVVLGGGSTNTTTVITEGGTTRTVTTSTPTTTPQTPAGQTPCPGGNGLSVNSVTTCPFAQNVENAYRANPSAGTYQVFSPVTNQNYTMTCNTGGGLVTCSGGNNAGLSFPQA